MPYAGVAHPSGRLLAALSCGRSTRGAAVLDTLSARVLYGVDDPNRSAGVTGALFRTAV